MDSYYHQSESPNTEAPQVRSERLGRPGEGVGRRSCSPLIIHPLSPVALLSSQTARFFWSEPCMADSTTHTTVGGIHCSFSPTRSLGLAWAWQGDIKTDTHTSTCNRQEKMESWSQNRSHALHSVDSWDPIGVREGQRLRICILNTTPDDLAFS